MKNKTLFRKRALAYIIDMIIISIIMMFLSEIPILKPNGKKYNEINEDFQTLMNDFEKDKITLNEFRNDYIVIHYKITKLENKINICKIIILFLYFTVLQKLLDGQTIGKKLLKIRTVSIDNAKLSFTSYFFRALIINDLFLYLMTVIGRFYINDISNYYLTLSISLCENIIIYTSVITILFRSDGRGIHDIIVKSKVIEE